MRRTFSFLIAFISIVSAVTGLVAFYVEYRHDIDVIISRILPSPPDATVPTIDCMAMQDLSERILCLNKQKQEREECAKANCKPATRGQAARA
jgi:hypothetical protein